MTYMVYPGATHKRFEHSLGVMELAGRAFDAITAVDNVDEQTRGLFPEITSVQFIVYWRKVLRIAALCHDLGHAPFSHAAEKELFPSGFDHEVITRNILQCEEFEHLFLKMVPRVMAEDVIKLALGRKKVKDLSFTDWETLLAEIITGDSLGVDRMDYLLRDAYHTGVGYGKFDHFRLLETIRIVPPPPTPAKSENQKEFDLQGVEVPEASTEPMLGLLIGGIHASEALLLARYFMYAQVYFHPVRIAYDQSLKKLSSCVATKR
jgi:HD superfamily phosphohydrolase